MAAQKAKEQQESQLRSSSSAPQSSSSSSGSSSSSSLFAGPAVASIGAATIGGVNASTPVATSDPAAPHAVDAAKSAAAAKSVESAAGADASSSSASVQSESDSERASLFAQSLSSLSSGEAREGTANGQDGGKKKNGPLASLIYGTTAGRNMEKELERSFSQVLARGKYVHSIVFHEVKPDKVDEYVELVGSWYPRLAKIKELGVNLVGSWRTEVGDCDTFGKSSRNHCNIRYYLCT